MRREAHFIKAQQGNSALNYEWCDRTQYAILQEEWIAAKRRKQAFSLAQNDKQWDHPPDGPTVTK